MPVYKYQALDHKGKAVFNMITAPSIEEAKRQLRLQSVMVSHIELRSGLRLKIGSDQVSALLHQMAMLLQAGFPLYEAMLALQEQYEGQAMHELLLDLADQIQSGSGLAQAMASYSKVFEATLTTMIRAGERGASLSAVLERASKVIASQQRIKKQLITAMIYPCLLAVTSFAILLLMLLFVVPSLEPLFDSRRPDSVLTNAVFGMSKSLRELGWGFVLTSTLGCAILASSLRRMRANGSLNEYALKIPIIGRLMIHARLARLGFVMEALLSSGVVLVEALDIAIPLMGTGKMSRELSTAKEKVLLGQSLSAALAESSLPSIVNRLIHLGENSGNLARSMAHLRELMDEELQKDLTRLTAAAQPVILIIMGGLVGLIMAAILIPLTDVGQLQGM